MTSSPEVGSQEWRKQIADGLTKETAKVFLDKGELGHFIDLYRAFYRDHEPPHDVEVIKDGDRLKVGDRLEIIPSPEGEPLTCFWRSHQISSGGRADQWPASDIVDVLMPMEEGNDGG